MIIEENGQVRLEKGEKAYKCVYLGCEIKTGNKKADGTPYSFSCHRFNLELKANNGGNYEKIAEALMDINYNPGLEKYKPALVIYAIQNPLKAPVVVGFCAVPKMVETTQQTSTPTVAPVQQVTQPASAPISSDSTLMSMNDENLPF